MSKTFEIPLQPSDADKALYRDADENVIRVRVQLPDGRLLASGDHVVELALSRDAMLALGSELIRGALLGSGTAGSWEIRPLSANYASEVLGVYSHPQGCTLVINKQPLGKVAQMLS